MKSFSILILWSLWQQEKKKTVDTYFWILDLEWANMISSLSVKHINTLCYVLKLNYRESANFRCHISSLICFPTFWIQNHQSSSSVTPNERCWHKVLSALLWKIKIVNLKQTNKQNSHKTSCSQKPAQTPTGTNHCSCSFLQRQINRR